MTQLSNLIKYWQQNCKIYNIHNFVMGLHADCMSVDVRTDFYRYKKKMLEGITKIEVH